MAFIVFSHCFLLRFDILHFVHFCVWDMFSLCACVWDFWPYFSLFISIFILLWKRGGQEGCHFRFCLIKLLSLCGLPPNTLLGVGFIPTCVRCSCFLCVRTFCLTPPQPGGRWTLPSCERHEPSWAPTVSGAHEDLCFLLILCSVCPFMVPIHLCPSR